MKKMIVVAVLFATFITGASAQKTFDGVYSKFSGEKGAESFKVNSVLLKLAFAFTKFENDEETKLFKSMKNIKILDVSACSDNVKDNFRKAVDRIDDSEYEMIMEMAEGKDQMKIFVKQKKDRICQFLFYNVGESPCLINIGGNFLKEEIQNLINYSAKKQEK